MAAVTATVDDGDVGRGAAVSAGRLRRAGFRPAPEVRSPKSERSLFAAEDTPWGDPDIAGVFTNNDESGIPLERPNQFEGKQLEDVSEGELEQLRSQREDQRVAAAPNLGGIPGTNPVHWFENFGAKNSRAWLLTDPADGRVPPLTDEAQSRPPVRGGSSFGGGPFNSIAGLQPVRSLHHPRHSRLDDAGHLRQRLSDRAGTGLGRRSATR